MGFFGSTRTRRVRYRSPLYRSPTSRELRRDKHEKILWNLEVERQKELIKQLKRSNQSFSSSSSPPSYADATQSKNM